MRFCYETTNVVEKNLTKKKSGNFLKVWLLKILQEKKKWNISNKFENISMMANINKYSIAIVIQ